MRRARAHPCWLFLAFAAAVTSARAGADPAGNNVIFKLSDEDYYEMPPIFHMEEYLGCLAQRGAYCLGSFELGAASTLAQPLYARMQGWSANWVDHFNHTQINRGLCLPRSCRHVLPADATDHPDLEEWFSSCVNASMIAEYGLWARPLKLEYCRRGPERDADEGLSASERGFAAVLATLFALTVLSTALDITLPDHAKKGCGWALSFSLRGSWRALQAPVATRAQSPGATAAGETDLRALDGLRVLCMMCVIIEHVCWLTTQAYVENIREFENMRHEVDVMLMANSTLVVQIFFLMSSFLLAHKLLQQRRRSKRVPFLHTFFDTMWNRIIRISPSYWIVVWFAATWWGRLGRGPLWDPMVGTEVDICQRKWWTHLLYLNNVINTDEKCLIQTWYLAADMQLYAVSLVLTLVLLRVRRAALLVLAALLGGSIALLAGLAYAWHLYPTYVLHNPELVRAVYTGESSFNVMYQSPLSNSPGALAGLLLAFTHHALLDARIHLNDYKLFRWISVLAPAVSVWWAAMSPLLIGSGPPARAPAAVLAAVERPVFSFFVALGLLGAMHDVQSPLRTLFSWRGWQVPARLSFGVLLLHIPLNKSLVANRLVASQLTRQNVIFEWFGVAIVSYACALPLAMVVEYPAQRLHRSVRALCARAAVTSPAGAPPAKPRPVPQCDKSDAAD